MKYFCQTNIDILFFIYGFSFIAMGLAIVMQIRRGSSFKIADILWLLGTFGLLHGVNEWLYMWAVIKQAREVFIIFDILRWGIFTASFCFLFEFGRRLFMLSASPDSIIGRMGQNRAPVNHPNTFIPQGGPSRHVLENSLRWAMSIRILVVLVLVSLIIGAFGKNFWQTSSVWIRYLIGLPGGILAALGFVNYFNSSIRETLPGLKKDFYLTAIFIFGYSLFSGLAGSPAAFFPTSLSNGEVFMKISYGIPMQLLRTFFAAATAIYVVKILMMFRWETIKNLCAVETEKFTDKIASSVEEMIMVIDSDFRIKWANKRLKVAYGPYVKGRYCYEVTHHLDKPCNFPDDACLIEDVKKTNKSKSVIHTHFDKNNKPIYTEVYASPLLDEEGNPTGDFIHTSRNVTDKTRAQKELEEAYTELKAIQEKLLSAEKMASLGKLSAGIAHEINNPIGYVISNLSSLEKYIARLLPMFSKYSALEQVLADNAKSEAEKLLAQIENIKKEIDFDYVIKDLPGLIKETADGAQRVVRIVRDLKSFARKDEIELKEADINELIESSLNIVWNEVKYKTDVIKEYGKLPKIPCHPQQITQAVMNILINAAQAIEKKGTITIKTYEKDNKVYIEIQDTGCGMSEETRKMIFEPFFTTKPVGEGTGLGLAILYGIIQKHKGSIEVKSAKGKGSTFIVALPVAAPKRRAVKKDADD